MLGACADTSPQGPESYVVRPQDTLYSIAWRHDLDYRDLARWNNIGSDFRISVGQVLLLGPGNAPPAEPETPRSSGTPAADAQAAPRVGKLRPLPAPPARAQSNAMPPVSNAAPSNNAAAPSNNASIGPPAGTVIGAASKWVWPTDRVGAPRPVPGGGILLAGRLGQDVRAASAGRVVYTGSGLRGYGNLIIIKHADSLLSAYAHNREMLVHEGQDVAPGQVIAHMGEGGPQTPVLYFEIRLNGRPVDPLPYFSKIK
jgi:lipoprotein NlpD